MLLKGIIYSCLTKKKKMKRMSLRSTSFQMKKILTIKTSSACFPSKKKRKKARVERERVIKKEQGVKDRCSLIIRREGS
jgi:hypothetical protein